MAKRHAKNITKQSDVDEILALTAEQAAKKETIMNYFADFGDGPRFNPYDTITIPKGLYGKNNHKNKDKFLTTVGLWVFNKGLIEDMSNVLGYVNKPVDDGTYKEINTAMSYALLEDKITVRQLKDFIMKTQIIMSCATAICPSHTMDMLLLTNKAEVKKKQLEKEHAKGLAEKDLTEMKAVEDGMIAWAKEELKDSESVDMYNSGARSSWGNNFKNMYLVKGPIKQTDGSYNYVSSSYISGMDPKDYANVNDAAVFGPYSRARKTQTGGYLEKQFTNATQHIKIGKPGSDCGSKHYVTITLTKKNISQWMYCFVVGNNGSLTEITTDNKDKFIGKTVKFRFSSLCEYKGDVICEKCAGTLFNRIGIKNVGLGTMTYASSLKNAAMKSFHDSTLNLVKIDAEEVFSLK